MKLLELTGIKNKIGNDKDITHIIIDLLKKNYKLLGTGSFGAAFDNPVKSNEVIKFWIKDAGYEHFLDLNQKMNSPALIKIIKRGSITLNFKRKITIKYVRLEKLKIAPSEIDDINLIDLLEVMEETFSYNDVKTNELIEHIFEDLKSLYEHIEEPFTSKGFSKETIEFILTANKLYNKLKNDEEWDLYPFNVLLRGNQLVITDPYASNKSKAIIDVDSKLYNFLNSVDKNFNYTEQ